MWFAEGEEMKTQNFKLKITAVFLLLIGMLTFSGWQTVKGAGKDF
jgi:predicted small secreted protein